MRLAMPALGAASERCDIVAAIAERWYMARRLGALIGAN